MREWFRFLPDDEYRETFELPRFEEQVESSQSIIERAFEQYREGVELHRQARMEEQRQTFREVEQQLQPLGAEQGAAEAAAFEREVPPAEQLMTGMTAGAERLRERMGGLGIERLAATATPYERRRAEGQAPAQARAGFAYEPETAAARERLVANLREAHPEWSEEELFSAATSVMEPGEGFMEMAAWGLAMRPALAAMAARGGEAAAPAGRAAVAEFERAVPKAKDLGKRLLTEEAGGLKPRGEAAKFAEAVPPASKRVTPKPALEEAPAWELAGMGSAEEMGAPTLRGAGGRVPPRKPPTAQAELPGMPPEEPKVPRPPTIREVEARSKPIPPEVRAELGNKPPQMNFELEPFDVVSQRWGDRFVENWWTQIEDLLGGKIPALARTPEALAVRRAFTMRDIYAATQGDSMRAGVLEWIGRNRKLLGLNGRGQAKAIKIAPGAEIPKGLEQRLMHIVEHPEKYIINPGQQSALKEAADRFTMMLRRQQAEGVNIREWQEGYWHRIVTRRPTAEPGRIGTSQRMGARPSAARMRVFGDIEDAWNRGYRYANDIDAMLAYGQDAAAAIADRNAVRMVQNLGFKPSEKVSGVIVQELKEAREAYKPARAAAAKKGATTVERATALEAAVRLDNAKQAMRLESRRWAERQPRVFGRIVSPEVAEEFSRYVGDLPGGSIDQAFQLMRANMIWGDLSAAGVQTQSLIWRDPVTWLKATAYSVRAMASEPTSYILKNVEAVESGIRYGAIKAPNEFLLRTGRGIAKTFGELPGVKQTQRAFEWDIFVAQTERWKAVQRMATSQDDLLELAAVIRAQTGVAMTPGLTTAQAKLLGRTWFAGRFLISTLSAFKNATKSGAAGHEARRTLAQIFGGVVGTIVGTNLALTGKPGNLHDPDRPGFLGIRAGEGFVYPFGPFQPLLVAVTRSTRASATLAVGGKPSSRDLQAWPRFIEGKLSLPYRVTTQALEALGVPLEAIRGEPYEQPQIEGVEGWLSQAGEYMPIGPSQAVQGIQKGFYAAALEPLGIRTTPLSPYAKLEELWEEKRGQMPAEYGTPPARLHEADDLQRKWFFSLPEVAKPEEEYLSSAEGRGKDWATFVKERNEAETVIETRLVSFTGVGPEFRDQYGEFRREWAIRANQEFGGDFERDPRSEPERAADEYWGVELTYKADGSRDWDTFFDQRNAVLDANPGLKQWIDNREVERWTDPAMKERVRQLQEADAIADEYYSIPAKIGMSAEEQDRAASNADQAQAIATQQGLPFVIALFDLKLPTDEETEALIYRKLPDNPDRRMYRYDYPEKWELFKRFYSDIPLSYAREPEPEFALAGAR